MNANERGDLEGGARALGQLMHAVAVKATPERFQEDGAARLLYAIALGLVPKRRRRTPRVALLLAAALATAALATLVLCVLWPWDSPVVAYRVEGNAEVDGPRVVAARPAPARLRFSEGSTVDLDPEAQLVVEGTTQVGARLRLQRGGVTVHIVHRTGAGWLVLAGPFWIRVVGTSFRARWEPARADLTVELLDGEIEVGGGTLSSGVRMSSGQRFHAVDGSGDWSVKPLSTPVVPSAPVAEGTLPPAPEPSASAAPWASGGAAAESRIPGPNPSASARSGPLDWPAALARGEFEQVVADAEARGIDACLATSSPKDLRALADAARYTGRLDLAERALVALRARSPGSSALTAYLLGSLNEARGKQVEALGWYEECLASAGAQEIAAEAGAGRLRMLQASRGAKAAREAAREYLRDYPGGVGAPTARRILESE